MKNRIMAMILAFAMALSLIPTAVFAAGNPDEGNIDPIPSIYYIDSEGEETANPTSLAPGQIWTNKNVIDNKDGTFEVTLYAQGATYDNGDEKKPLADGSTDVTVTDVIGAMFELDGAITASKGTASISSGVVTWVISQDDILTGLQSCTFTVSLIEGWVVETPYYTNVAASATFTPREGNPYYYTKQIVEIDAFELSDINWNNGQASGINTLKVTDNIIGVTFSIKNVDPFNAMGYDGITHSFAFSTQYSSEDGVWRDPINAANFSWGCYWVKGGGNNKIYYLWVKGLEGSDVVTRYAIHVTNNGGNTGGVGERTTIAITSYLQIKSFTWDGDDIIDNLPNKGVIKLTYVPMTTAGAVTFNKVIQLANGFENAGADEFAFDLYRVDENRQIIGSAIGTYYTELGGVIYAENLEPGKYVFIEKMKDGWILLNYEDGVYFEMVYDPYHGSSPVWELEEDSSGDVPVVINSQLGSLEVSLDVQAQDYHYEYTQDYHDEYLQDYHYEYKQDYHNEYKQDYHYEYKQDWHNEYLQDWHNEYTQDWHNEYKQDWHNEFLQDYHNEYLQDWHNEYKQDYHYEYLQDWHNEYLQDWHMTDRPSFEKRVSSNSDTLVTARMNNAIPGGTFGNGMTYIEVNVADAKAPGGIDFTIADSSKSNKEIGYGYNIRIEGDELVLSLDNRLISASVTAKLYNSAPSSHDPSGHKTITNGQELRVKLPAAQSSNGNNKNNSGPTASATKSGDSITVLVTYGGNVIKTLYGTYAKNGKETINDGEYTVNLEYNGNGIKSVSLVSYPSDLASGGTGGSSAGLNKFYMFVHFNSLKWFTTGLYEFTGWQDYEKILDGDRYGETKKLDGNRYSEKKIIDGERYDGEKKLDGDPRYYEKVLDGDPRDESKVLDGKRYDELKVLDGDPRDGRKVLDGDPRYYEKVLDGDPRIENKVLDGNPYFFEKVLDGDPPVGNRVTDGDPIFIEKINDGDPYLVKKVIDRERYEDEKKLDGDPYDGEKKLDGERDGELKVLDGEHYYETKVLDGERYDGTKELDNAPYSTVFNNDYTVKVIKDGNVVSTDTLTNSKKTALFNGLEQGEYTVNLLLDSNELVSQKIIVFADKKAEVSFTVVIDGVQGSDVNIDGVQGADVDKDGIKGADVDNDGEKGLDVLIDGDPGEDVVIDGKIGEDVINEGDQGEDIVNDGVQGGDVVKDGVIGADVVIGIQGGDVVKDGVIGADVVIDGVQGGDVVKDGTPGTDVIKDGIKGNDVSKDGTPGADVVNDGKQGNDVVKDGTKGNDVVNDGKQGNDVVKDGVKGSTVHACDECHDDAGRINADINDHCEHTIIRN